MTASPAERRHVLTVLHSFERTGPPILALRYLRWLRSERPQWRLSTVSMGGADDLQPDFAELGTAFAAAPVDPAGSLAHAGRARFANLRVRRAIAALGHVDLAHVHCAGTMRCLDVVRADRVLCHLHELSVSLEHQLRPRAAANLTAADRYVAVSDAVRAAFLERFDVPAEVVTRQWGFAEPAELTQAEARSRLGVPAGDALIVGSGVRNWRKAPELFVRVARRAVSLRPDVGWRFVWVGGDDTDLQRLVDSAGLGSVVTFLDHRPDASEWIAAADVFLLTAREDAFPLVCVEAATAGTPVLTWDNGGAPELVSAADCGAVVPFPDVDAMADQLIGLVEDPARRSGWGLAGAEFARAHLTVEQAGPVLLETMDQLLAVAGR